MTTTRNKWKVAYRTGRIAIPAAQRGRLSYDRMTGNWTKTPRYNASRILNEVVADAVRALGADVGGNPFTADWRMVNGVEEALRPVESLQQKLGENVLNGFGMFNLHRSGRPGFYAVNTRRHALVSRMIARGAVLRDPSNHIREWSLGNGLLTSDRYGEFINQSGARTA